MSVSMDTNQLAQQIKDVTLDAVNAIKEAVVGSNEATPVDDKHRVFIGNLNFDTTEDDIKTFFAQAGEIVSVTLPTKRNYRTKSTQPSGIAFVGYTSDAEAEKAVETLNSKTLGEREINVAIARPLSERKPKAKSAKTSAKSQENINGNESASGVDGEKKARAKKPRAKKPSATAASAEDGAPSSSETASGATTKTRTPREKLSPADAVPSTTTLFVAGLDSKVTDEQLKEMFAKYNPQTAHVTLRILPRFMIKKLAEKGEQRLNRGFGFVTFTDETAQTTALKAMDGQKIGESELAVKVAMDRKVEQGTPIKAESPVPTIFA